MNKFGKTIEMSNENPTFHLGITMAGAVSAGCYTAGVMDYILEVLDLWEKAKNNNIESIDQKLVPKHNVVIDVMGGASAGGMTTIMTAFYLLLGKINPVKNIPTNLYNSQNLLFDTWIHLDDDEQKTFQKLWSTNDLQKGIFSLLNSDSIESIADKLIQKVQSSEKNNLPSFISPKLEVILSHSLIRGIPLSVDFKVDIAKRNKYSPKHNTFEHYFVSHFKIDNENPVNINDYLPLDPFKAQNAERLKQSTIATGAFPIGLKYKKFDKSLYPINYIKSVLKRIVTGDFSETNPDKNEEIHIDIESDFESLTIDGGAINNEPYREIESILKSKAIETELKNNYGIIMIDPFPDNGFENKDYDEAKNLFAIVPKIIKMLWNQSKVKRKEMYEQYSKKYFKGVIYPKKYVLRKDGTLKEDKYPLTSASFGAFGGFLDVEFRSHDFFLGRNNARNFLQYFGSLPYDPKNGIVNPIHENWSIEMINKFKLERDGEVYLPIIPDINLLIDNKEPGQDRYIYTYDQKPKLDPSMLFGLEGQMQKRIKWILRNLELKSLMKENSDRNLSDYWQNKFYKKNWVKRKFETLFSTILNKTTKVVSGSIAKAASKAIIRMILNDLDKMGILKEPKSNKNLEV